jgi:hypothetical protein
MKVFIWGILEGGLTSCERLKKYNLGDGNYPFCSVKETTLHMLWFYQITQDIWCKYRSKLYAFIVANSWKEGIIGLGIPLDKIFSMIIVNMIISYHILKTRCKVLFEEGFLVNVVETISDIISMFLL